LREIAEGPGLERVIHRDAADEDLADIYAGAEALVVTSHHEGFCLPLVEAAAVGCPVIVADFPVAHEVIGTGASYFRAGDAEALAELLVAPEVWVRGGARAVRTWRDTARETAEVYRSVRGRR
jgi:glycosyltransferase involved in cell wall biosynthesis